MAREEAGMAASRSLLLTIIVTCMVDLLRSRRVSSRPPGSLRVLLVAGGSSHEVEGLVRYLHWELSMRNGLQAEIAVSCEDASRECSEVARLLARDGLLVQEFSGEPSLVFRI